jgi:hypothetical protein
MPFINNKYSTGIKIEGPLRNEILDYFLMETKYPDITYWSPFEYNGQKYIVDFQYNVYHVHREPTND